MPSVFNQLLGTRFPRMSKILFGIDADQGVGSLAPEIMPTAEMLNPPIEGRWPAGEKVASLVQIVPSVAGEFSYIGVRNPAASGMIVVAELIIGGNAGGVGPFFVRLNNADPTRTLDSGIISYDLRWSVALSNATTARVILGSEAVITGTNIGRLFSALGMTIYPLEFVLPPGTNVIIHHETVNTAFTGGVRFRERPARPDELA